MENRCICDWTFHFESQRCRENVVSKEKVNDAEHQTQHKCGCASTKQAIKSPSQLDFPRHCSSPKPTVSNGTLSIKGGLFEADKQASLIHSPRTQLQFVAIIECLDPFVEELRGTEEENTFSRPKTHSLSQIRHSYAVLTSTGPTKWA